MTKKDFGKQLITGAKIVTSTIVGTGAAVVTDFVFRKYAPAESESAFRRMTYFIGAKGVSIVIGAEAADLTTKELDAIEAFAKEKLENRKEKKETTK